MDAVESWYSEDAHVLLTHAALGGSIGIIMASAAFLFVVGFDYCMQKRAETLDQRVVALAGRIVGDCIEKLRDIGKRQSSFDTQRSAAYLQKPVVRRVLEEELSRRLRSGQELRVAARLEAVCGTVYCEIDFTDKKAESSATTLTLWPTRDSFGEREYHSSTESKKDI